MERPSATLPLANFVSATFTNCQAATGGGPLHPIWDYPNLAETMTSSSDTLWRRCPHCPTTGPEFTATWHNGT